MKQVVTFAADGSVQGLQVKPGKGFDLRKLGHAAIERSSEILWSEDQQAWTIRVLDENACRAMAPRDDPARGVTVTLRRYRDATGRTKPDVPHLVCMVPEPLESDWLYFGEYDDAVAVEIAVLDGLRKKGLLN